MLAEYAKDIFGLSMIIGFVLFISFIYLQGEISFCKKELKELKKENREKHWKSSENIEKLLEKVNKK